MIGVLCSEGERESAREFFELFKTPWEFFASTRNYEVVISTLQETPELNTKLVVIYSSSPTQFDICAGINVDPAVCDHFIDHNQGRFPIYGLLARFNDQGQPLIRNKSEIIVIQLFTSIGKIVRAGYDLFKEVAFLLAEGQSVENALISTLEFHISLLRSWIVRAGIPVIEIPPIPWGHSFIACLTHDVDFVGIRRHKLDHTILGFVYRALVGSFLGFLRSTCSYRHLVRNWAAVLSLPLIYLGVLDDFWEHFDRYADVEKGVSSTFFLIPFKHRVGDKVQGKFPTRRAAHYDIGDVRKQVQTLIHRGYEIGLHGIDAWHSVDKGKQELNRVVEATGQKTIGVRMHWLCFDHSSPVVLEQAGFDYDATSGYNEMIGYRAGTTQVFSPSGATRLLELPLHIQDTALFYPHRLGLTEAQAWELCESLLNTVIRFGGVLTVSWHERSLAPERLWGEFYRHLLQELRVRGAWFGSAGQVVQWFRARRSVVFEGFSSAANTVRLRLKHEIISSEPLMFLRVYRPLKDQLVVSNTELSYVDYPYHGESLMQIQLD
jgi:hypothetical protein